MSRTSIETVTGQFLDFANPTAKMITVEAIAWGLSRQPRFCGQTVSEFPYSVAQHSVHVMNLIEAAMTPGSHTNFMVQQLQNPDLHSYLSTPSQLKKDRRLATLLGLFHDGSEAFLCDIPTPAKRLPGLMEAYGAVESRLMRAIHDSIKVDQASITPEIQAIVHWADQYALSIEALHLVPSRGASDQWAFLLEPAAIDVLMWGCPVSSSREAFELFMIAYQTFPSDSE